MIKRAQNFLKQSANPSGQILLLVMVALGVILFTVLFIVSGAQVYFQNSQYSYQAESATAVAEAGVDKAIASLNKTGGLYNGEIETSLGSGSYSVTIANKDAGSKIVSVTGYVPNKANAKSKKTITVQTTNGVGVAFNYGLQIGEGGLCMGNGSVLNGSIYSNGNVTGGNLTTINGDIYIAGGAQPSADQQSDCAGVNCQDYIFGKSVSAESRLDVAQSFKPSLAGNLNKISLKLKKIGNPPNPTVRIMADNSGKPDKNNVLASGVLSASLVSTSQFSFVDVTFSSTPALSANTSYWIMIDTGALDSLNYWYWSNDLAGGYTQGLPKWSSNWRAQNPAWTAISGDLGFKTYMGGVVTSLSLTSGSKVTGSVHANTISGSMTINKDAYYQILGSSVTIKGVKYPNSADPAPGTFPVSDANVADWKDQAAIAGVTTGNISGGNGCILTLGPRKIVGNISLGNGCSVTVKTPLWVTGNISGGNVTKFILDSSFGSHSGQIIVDGRTTLGNGSDLKGSGLPGSYLMLFSTFDSTLSGEAGSCNEGSESGQVAVDAGNSAVSGILYAPKGIVNLSNGASFKEITAWLISLGNNGVLNYDSGLASTNFSAGPSGSFSLIKGTYQIK